MDRNTQTPRDSKSLGRILIATSFWRIFARVLYFPPRRHRPCEGRRHVRLSTDRGWLLFADSVFVAARSAESGKKRQKRTLRVMKRQRRRRRWQTPLQCCAMLVPRRRRRRRRRQREGEPECLLDHCVVSSCFRVVFAAAAVVQPIVSRPFHTRLETTTLLAAANNCCEPPQLAYILRFFEAAALRGGGGGVERPPRSSHRFFNHILRQSERATRKDSRAFSSR